MKNRAGRLMCFSLRRVTGKDNQLDSASNVRIRFLGQVALIRTGVAYNTLYLVNYLYMCVK